MVCCLYSPSLSTAFLRYWNPFVSQRVSFGFQDIYLYFPTQVLQMKENLWFLFYADVLLCSFVCAWSCMYVYMHMCVPICTSLQACEIACLCLHSNGDTSVQHHVLPVFILTWALISKLTFSYWQGTHFTDRDLEFFLTLFSYELTSKIG